MTTEIYDYEEFLDSVLFFYGVDEAVAS